MLQKIKNIAVLGDGGWGTTLAIHLHNQGFKVTLWSAFSEYCRELNRTRNNRKFLPGIKIPKDISIVDDLKSALDPADVIVLAVPSQYLRKVLNKFKAIDLSKKIFLSVVKGVEEGTLKRMSEVITEELGQVKLAVLSGPTIATEVAQKIPTTAVIASQDRKTAQLLQRVVNSNSFRIYTNNDVLGVELGGSIKNVIAISCGVCDGLGFGSNAKAAILARGLAEMTRLAKSMGAKTETLFGLSGLGDLATTAFSPKSRNRFVGEELGKGKKISRILKDMDMVAEGVTTVNAVYRLANKYKVSMPITTEVYKIIYKNKKARRAVADLMGRKMKAE